jgi:imidazolonepropionase-like amidohydrolase
MENAAQYVRRNKEEGADYIKLFQENCRCFATPTGSIPTATLDLQKAITQAAHAEALLVLAHANSVEATEIVLDAGVDGLTHTSVDQPPPLSLIERYQRTNAFVIPTLTALSTLTGEAQDFRDKFATIAEKQQLVDKVTLELMRKSVSWNDKDAKFDYAVQSVRALHDAGIDIVAGTDSMAGLNGTALGPSLWMELEMYHILCNMSILQVLRSTTAVPAKRFKFFDRGAIEPGKRADIVLVRGDVTVNLQCLWEGDGILAVWKEGLPAAR